MNTLIYHLMRIASLVLSRHVWVINHLSVVRGRLLKQAHRKMLFLDLDGTLWPDSGSGAILKCQRISKDWKKYISQAKRDGYHVAIFTNQTLFSRNPKFLIWEFLLYVWSLGKLFCVTRPAVLLVCHHHPNAQFAPLKLDCSFRKPSPVSIQYVLRRLRCEPQLSFLIGDRISDAIAGNLAGLQTNLVKVNPEMFVCNVSGNYPESCYAFFKPSYTDNPSNLRRSFI